MEKACKSSKKMLKIIKRTGHGDFNALTEVAPVVNRFFKKYVYVKKLDFEEWDEYKRIDLPEYLKKYYYNLMRN